MMDFQNLWWLFLLPLPWLVRKFLQPATVKNDAGLKVPFYAYLRHCQQAGESEKNLSWRLYVAYLIWLLLVVAATGPQWLGKPYDLPRSGRDILLAIDISGSMRTFDMEINNQPSDRLSVVKNVAQQFIRDRKGDRLGLILFGTRAYLQTPLTFDLKTVRHMLLDATVGLAGTQTAIGDAIGMAIKHLKNYPQDSKVLILLTDGINNDGNVSPLEAAKMAAKYGIRIYTVGLGPDQVTEHSLTGSQMLVSGYDELDEGTLKEIAAITQGIYFHASNPEDLRSVYQQLNEVEPRVGEKEIFHPKMPLYYWPLGLAFLLSILLAASMLLPIKNKFEWGGLHS